MSTVVDAPLPRTTVRRMLVPAACAACFVGQSLWFIGAQSLTYDEPVHVIAGLDAWRGGRFDRWNDQPPLARLLLTIPIHFLDRTDWRLDDRGPAGANFWTIAVSPDARRLAWQTRPVNLALGLALGILLWLTAKRLFSEAAANFSLALASCSPALIAHFSLATVDGAATLMLFATAVAVIRCVAAPSWRTTVVLGMAFAGLLLAKFSAPPMVLLGIGIIAVTAPSGDRARRLVMTGCAVVLAFVVVWAFYRFHVGPVTFRNGSLIGPYARTADMIVPTARPLNVTVRVPAPEYVTALGGVLQHSVRGQPSSLAGEVRTSGGWRRYYPMTVLLKWPVTMWIFAVMALVRLAGSRVRVPRNLAILMLFPAAYFGLAMLSNLDIGDRYVLPVYPFLVLLCGAAWTAVRPQPAAVMAIVGLLALQATDVLRYAPDDLSYFNAFVKPDESYRWLSDSSLDWGQGLLALQRYERAHPDEAIWLAYFGGVDPQSYGLRARMLSEDARVTGTVVVSATHLSGQYLRNPRAFHWLLAYPRTAILDHSLYVFRVP